MPVPSDSAFALPAQLSAKADHDAIGGDDRHFAAIAAALQHSIADLSERLDSTRRATAGGGTRALDRDQEIHRLTSRLRTLRRYGQDLCLGRMVFTDDPEPVYLGRIGLTDADGNRLLVDWRVPAAAPFFGATHGDPMGLASRRRYRWGSGKVRDYWDEVFTAEGLAGNAALDDQSAFVASLGGERSERMRDVLGTIQADQDAIIRAGSRGPLVVDGGPGTGKTVVALHRTAFLLYSDARLSSQGGRVLFIGPHRPYLAYVSDVLPSLGEDGVLTATLRDLVPEGEAARPESDPQVARLKASADLVAAIEPAVRLYEEPLTTGLTVHADGADVRLTPADWAAAFEAAEPGTPHNEAGEQVWDALIEIAVEKVDEDEVDVRLVRDSLRRNEELRDVFNGSWPNIEATDLVGDLWTVPAYLRRCAPGLEGDQVRALQRADPAAWTESDLPLLDAAHRRLGDSQAIRRERRRRKAIDAEREQRSQLVADMIESDDSEMHVMSMLRGDDLSDALVDEDAYHRPEPDQLAGPFAHVVVDEAQELTDAQWQMVLARCPSRSLTIVGDRAQARAGFPESWQERLARVGLDRVEQRSLTINYRTPSEVMDHAAPVIRAVLPDANVPTSIRSNGLPVITGDLDELESLVEHWLSENAEGTVCVIGDPTFRERDRAVSLTPELAKGLEFDLVVLVDPESFGDGVQGAVDRYVSMTRATRQLVVLTRG